MLNELIDNGTTAFHIFIAHRTRTVNCNQNTGTEFVTLTRNIKSLTAVRTHTSIFRILINGISLESTENSTRVKFRSICSKNSLQQTTTNITPARTIFSNMVGDFLNFLVYESIFFPTFSCLFGGLFARIQIFFKSLLGIISITLTITLSIISLTITLALLITLTIALTIALSLALTLLVTTLATATTLALALSTTTLTLSLTLSTLLLNIIQNSEHLFKEPVFVLLELIALGFFVEFSLSWEGIKQCENFRLMGIQHTTLVFVKANVVRCLLETINWIAFTSSRMVQSNSQTFTINAI